MGSRPVGLRSSPAKVWGLRRTCAIAKFAPRGDSSFLFAHTLARRSPVCSDRDPHQKFTTVLLSRTISFVASFEQTTSAPGSSILRTNSRTAIAPISAIGSATVDSRGRTSREICDTNHRSNSGLT